MHVLSDDSEEVWEGERGRVSTELISKYLHTSESNVKALICGPTAFNTAAIQ